MFGTTVNEVVNRINRLKTENQQLAVGSGFAYI